MMAAGGAVIIVQAVWISYGVIMRYVFRSPDAVVTEATALLLFPVAFAGLAYAMQIDAYPRVTMLVNKFSPATRMRLEVFHCFLPYSRHSRAHFFVFIFGNGGGASRMAGFCIPVCGIGNFTLAALFVLGSPSALSVFIFAQCFMQRRRCKRKRHRQPDENKKHQQSEKPQPDEIPLHCYQPVSRALFQVFFPRPSALHKAKIKTKAEGTQNK